MCQNKRSLLKVITAFGALKYDDNCHYWQLPSLVIANNDSYHHISMLPKAVESNYTVNLGEKTPRFYSVFENGQLKVKVFQIQ